MPDTFFVILVFFFVFPNSFLLPPNKQALCALVAGEERSR